MVAVVRPMSTFIGVGLHMNQFDCNSARAIAGFVSLFGTHESFYFIFFLFLFLVNAIIEICP